MIDSLLIVKYMPTEVTEQILIISLIIHIFPAHSHTNRNVKSCINSHKTGAACHDHEFYLVLFC